MLNDTLKKINLLLAKFNQTFEIEANIVGETADTLSISGLKNDGKEFMTEMFDIFAKIVKQSSDDGYELVYDLDKGLALAKKCVIVKYEIEDQEGTSENDNSEDDDEDNQEDEEVKEDSEDKD